MSIPPEKHQGFNPADDGKEPRDTVLLVEPQTAHRRFLQSSQQETKVLLRINHVRTLLNRGQTADSYYSDNTTVVTTTTVHDRHLSNLSWKDELERIREFEPDYHIPCDYPVYKHDSEDTRREHLKNCLEGTLWIGGRLSDVKTQIIPLVKGETTGERGLCYKIFDRIDAEYVAFYAAQYFLSGKGFSPLNRTLRAIASERPNLKLLVIGLQSPRLLDQVPPQIVAAAGQRWIDEVQLRNVPISESQKMFGEFDQKIEGSLSMGQTPLGMWTASAEVTA